MEKVLIWGSANYNRAYYEWAQYIYNENFLRK